MPLHFSKKSHTDSPASIPVPFMLLSQEKKSLPVAGVGDMNLIVGTPSNVTFIPHTRRHGWACKIHALLMTCCQSRINARPPMDGPVPDRPVICLRRRTAHHIFSRISKSRIIRSKYDDIPDLQVRRERPSPRATSMEWVSQGGGLTVHHYDSRRTGVHLLCITRSWVARVAAVTGVLSIHDLQPITRSWSVSARSISTCLKGSPPR